MRWDGWLFGSTELQLELGAVCQVTNQPAWPRLGQTVWKQSKSLNQSRRSKQPSNSQEWKVFTGIPQISTLRKKRFFNVINFLPLNQWLGRSSHDDRSHHHHPPAIHQAIMIMFCIIRHKTGGQAGPVRHRGRAVDRKGLRLRLISAPLNHRLNQFSAHKLPPTCWLTDIGRHVRQRLWQWIYRKPNFGSWLFHNFNSWVLCPLSFDIVRRLKHHDFSQQEFQLAYSRLYDFLMAEGSKTYCCGGHLSILPNLLLFPYIMPDPSMPATGPSCRLKLL